MKISKTSHAQKRLQQRGISNLEMELILSYGREYYQGKGQTYTYIDKKGLERLEADLRKVTKNLERLKNIFVVDVDSKAIITVGHKYKKPPLH